MSPRSVTLLLLAALAASPASHAQDRQQPDEPGSGLVFGPKLLFYPMECQDPRGCRIDCFQNGIAVFSRAGISLQDEVRLAINTGISDEIIPRWIEIRPFSGKDVQTLLLTRDTACDLKAFSIVPRGQQ